MDKDLCLVTGGAGAIGSHLVGALLRQGAKVDVLDDLSYGRTDNLPVTEDVCLLLEDITDASRLKQVLRGRRYRYVFHLAAHYANSLSINEPDRDLQVNLLGTVYLLQNLDLTDLERFVFASSSCVYGSLGCSPEYFLSLPGDLDSPYAISKYAGEALVNFWMRQYGLKAVILRYFNVYGPNSWPGPARSVIPNFFEQALTGKPLPITGTGEEVRDFTYIDDTIAATLAAASEQAAVGGTFNVGTGQGIAIRVLAEKINSLVGNKAGIHFLPRRPWDRCHNRVADMFTTSSTLRLGSPVPLDKGLNMYYSWILTKTVLSRVCTPRGY